MLLLIACTPPMPSAPAAPSVEPREDTGDAGPAHTLPPSVPVTLTATFLFAWMGPDGNEASETRSADGARFWVTHWREETMATAEPSDPVASGTAPATAWIAPGAYCAQFAFVSDAGARYASAPSCFHTDATRAVNGSLCVDLTGDWTCEDIWGEGTPETRYVNNGVAMENGCDVELVGVTWGGQAAHVDGHRLTFALGGYAATGYLEETGDTMPFLVEYDLSYWSVCNKLY